MKSWNTASCIWLGQRWNVGFTQIFIAKFRPPIPAQDQWDFSLLIRLLEANRWHGAATGRVDEDWWDRLSGLMLCLEFYLYFHVRTDSVTPHPDSLHTQPRVDSGGRHKQCLVGVRNGWCQADWLIILKAVHINTASTGGTCGRVLAQGSSRRLILPVTLSLSVPMLISSSAAENSSLSPSLLRTSNFWHCASTISEPKTQGMEKNHHSKKKIKNHINIEEWLT